MIDYYEELTLSRKMDIKRIQEELVRLESLWHKREVNSPEKANKMLGLIMEAQKVFASEASRRKYDSDLGNSRKEPEAPEVLRLRSLEKWTNQARMFFNDGQYDLAKASIDRALNYADGESDNGDLFQLAANIYLENGDVRLSLECINKAIITSPDWADYYIVKAQIYDRMSLTDQQYDKKLNDINECRNNLMQAVSKARVNDDAVVEGGALGMLAFSLYFHDNPDAALAEEYARRAEELGEHTNSKKVLDGIIEKIYNEAKKEEEGGDLQHLRKALELYERLEDWRDASERAAACRTHIGEEVRRQREEQRRRKEQERLKREYEVAIKKKRDLYIIGWTAWAVIMVFFWVMVYPKGMLPMPMFLILAVIGTIFPSYAESEYIDYYGVLGALCIFNLLCYCIVFVKCSGDDSYITLCIVLVVLQIASRFLKRIII